MKLKILVCLFVLVYTSSFGCRCSTNTTLEYYRGADFVATARIVTIQPDSQNQRYHDITIDIITLYKGEPIDSLKITSILNSSCAFYTPEGSTWLIYASKDSNGVLSFGSCSGSLQLDRQFDETKYAGLTRNYAERIRLKEETLNYLKAHKDVANNPYKLTVNYTDDCINIFKGFQVTNRMAIYEVKVSANFAIKNIQVPRSFNNKDLSARIIDCLKQNLRISSKELPELPKDTSLLLIYYYYPGQENHQSFISQWDL